MHFTAYCSLYTVYTQFLQYSVHSEHCLLYTPTVHCTEQCRRILGRGLVRVILWKEGRSQGRFRRKERGEGNKRRWRREKNMEEKREDKR